MLYASNKSSSPEQNKEVVWKPQPGSQTLFLDSPVRETLYAGTRGPGKSQPLSAPVLTPTGWKPIGELKVGDVISHPYSEWQTVTGVFPQGVKETVQVNFKDGTSAPASPDHLWRVGATGRGVHWGLGPDARVLTTDELRKWEGKTFFVPMTKEQEFESTETLEIDPYLLGLYLGDGCSIKYSVAITTTDPETEEYLLSLGFLPKPPISFRAPGTELLYKLRALGLESLTSQFKFVPEKYLWASAADRWALFQGLMDSDGSVKQAKNCLVFGTISPQLAEAVAFLARSLGGTAFEYTRPTQDKPEFQVYITFEDMSKAFRLTRKKDLCKPRPEFYGPSSRHKKYIADFEDLEPEEHVCISVSGPDQVYITSGFIVTHNTDALLMDFAQHVGEGYGAEWQGILFRETYLQLADVIKKTKKWFPRIWPKAVYNKSDRVWTWPTGESLRLAYMNDPEDYWNYHGHAYPWIGWEELCNWINSDCYTVMMSCNRSTVKDIPRKIRATTNPYGKGHNWVRKRWRLPESFGRIIREHDGEGNPLPPRLAIHGSLLENKILLDADPDYISNLRAAARNPEELKAWLHGSWDIVSGGAFDDLWDPSVHILPRSKIPPNWRVFRSYDWGSSRPFSVGWWAEANGEEMTLSDGRVFSPPRGSLIRIAEWYGTKELGTNKGLFMSSAKQAQGIKEREANLIEGGWVRSRIQSGPADNSIFDKNPDSDSIAAIHENQGVFWEKSNKNPGSRERGLELIRQRLENSVNKEGPGIYFMRGCWQRAEGCDATIELFPRLPRDEDNPDDIDTDAEDHFYDEIRYSVLDANDRYPVGLKISFPS